MTLQSTTENIALRSGIRGTFAGAIALGVAVLASGIVFWSGITALLVAWEKPEYSHGYIIPFVAAFIALKRLPPATAGMRELCPGFGGSAVVALGLAVGIFGNLAGIPDIVTYGLLIAIAGLVIAILGWRRSLPLWPAWIYLGFMLPLPNFIYWPLSIKLQFLSSTIGVELIKLMGVPVYLDGNIIDLGNYKLQVAEACSGLRYLFPLASFGFLFAVLYRGPVWHKLVIFLAAIPITILMNSVRIGVIGLLVDRYGIAQAEGFLHMFEGWVIFAICIVVLFLLAILLQRFTAKPQPLAQVLDLGTEGLVKRLSGLARPVAGTPLIVAAGLALVAAVGNQAFAGRTPTHPERTELAQFPMTIGDWRGESRSLDWDTERVLGADDYLVANYQTAAGGASQVNLLVSYYRSQTEGSGIHSPEVCIPAGGWEVSRWEQAEITFANSALRPLPVNRAIIQKGVDRQLVYYWFEQRGRQITNDYAAKAYTVWDSVTKRRSDGALVRIVTPIIGAEPVEDADRRLRMFLETALVNLPAFVPP